jgi:hypothetical protein
MLKGYLIVVYAYKVKTGQWDLEPVVDSTKSVVPEAYRAAVADYLITAQ